VSNCIVSSLDGERKGTRFWDACILLVSLHWMLANMYLTHVHTAELTLAVLAKELAKSTYICSSV
jgi:hypothetical protein